METSQLQRQHWRKSQQWFILNRGHAELVVADQHVKEVFKRYCWSYGKHICVSDEHYIPTLLASYNLDEQVCDCISLFLLLDCLFIPLVAIPTTCTVCTSKFYAWM